MLKANEFVTLTTVDNPFHPIKQFEDWWRYDTEMGYNTLGLIQRLAMTNSNFSEYVNKRLTEFAIEEIIDGDFLGRYEVIRYTND